MTQLLAIFTPKNPFTSIITQKDLESHLRVSSSLVKQVQEHPKQFAKFINQRQEHQIREIEKLTLMHLLFMHAPELAETFESMQLSLRADDPWINANIITPYQNFIRKLILSNQQYNKVRIINNGWNSLATSRDTFFNKQLMRQNPKIYFNFQVLCYCVNMLNQCLAFLKKVPTLGRYYPKNVNNCYSSFVNVASYQVVLFYFSFKFIANELLLRHKDYLLNEHEEKFFIDILQNRLESINQEMKALLLNKYYNPIEKGIKITLLEIQRFSDQGRQALIELNILQRQNQQKTKKNRQFLGKKIFGGGDFDSNVFEQSINLISTREYRQLDLQEIYDKENMNIINKRAIQKPEMKDRLPNQQYSNNILTDL